MLYIVFIYFAFISLDKMILIKIENLDIIDKYYYNFISQKLNN